MSGLRNKENDNAFIKKIFHTAANPILNYYRQKWLSSELQIPCTLTVYVATPNRYDILNIFTNLLVAPIMKTFFFTFMPSISVSTWLITRSAAPPENPIQNLRDCIENIELKL